MLFNKRPGSTPTLCLVHVLFFTFCFFQSAAGQSTPTLNNETVRVLGPDGTWKILAARADEDGDGIENELEINGYFWDSDSLKIRAWDGDENQPFFITDPLQASTDQDPYSDFTEVSGVNLDVGVFPPEDHPLVAARPRIGVKMVSYEVKPTVVITDARGGAQGSSYTTEVSNSTTVGVEVTSEVGFSLEGPSSSVSVSSSYSETQTFTESSTSSSEINWESARTTEPGRAAELELIVYVENTGSTEALNVVPTVNLKLSDKILATFDLPSTVSLTPRGTTGSRTSEFNVSQANGEPISITIQELRAIQRGTPLTLEVIQVDADVETLDAGNTTVTKSWNEYIGDIDLVSVDFIINKGSDEPIRHSVFAATGTRYDPEFTMQEVLSNIVDVEEIDSENVRIEGRDYPGDWYAGSPSEAVINQWETQQRPSNLLSLRMHPGTQLILWSPGDDANPTIDLASYSSAPGDTSSYSRVLVSARPNNGVPISSVRAEVSISGEVNAIELTKNESGFYTNTIPISGTPDGPGIVYAENAVGDVSEAPITLPAFYSNAADVMAFSAFIPNPGGNYWIYQNGEPDKPMLLYCLFNDPETGDALAEPREYLQLNNREPQSSFSDLFDDAQHGRYYFDRARINPRTLKLATKDTTFISAPEWIAEQYIPTHAPVTLGQINIISAHLDSAAARIDIRDTPFYIDPYATFSTAGAPARERIFIDRKRQVLSVIATAAVPGPAPHGQTGVVSDSLQLVYGQMDASISGIPFGGHSILLNDSGGERGYVTMGDASTLEVTNAITLETWINPTAIGGGANNFAALINKEDEYELLRWDDGGIRWAFAFDEPHWTSTNTYYEAPENEWTHIAVTYDQNAAEPAVKTYINGILFHAMPASGPIERFTRSSGVYNDFWVGGRESNTDSFVGFMDDVRLWNVARTAEEIQTSFMAPLNGPESGLIGYWQFDTLEDLGIMGDGADDVRDLSGFDHHGDLVGDAISSAVNVSIEDEEDLVATPESYTLDQNYPNPFNPTTTIQYTLPQADDVQLVVYNMLGQEVRTLVATYQQAGRHQVAWDGRASDGSPVATGVYLYRISAGDFVGSRQMLLVK